MGRGDTLNRAWRYVLLGLATALVAAWAQDAVVAKLLHPDAELPPVTKQIPDLGERHFSPKEEKTNSADVIKAYARPELLCQDPKVQQRIETIGHRIITAAKLLGPRQIPLDGPKDPELTFTFRVIDIPDINAFSAWGGNIFITRRLVEFCQSDDEIAGILGHETAHTMFHHLHDQVQRAQRYQTQQILIMLAAAFGGLDTMAKASMMAQYLYVSIYNGHTVEQEAQADWAGCYYCYRAGYNPVGLVTTMERLHKVELSQPMPKDLGIFQTHPWSDQRARSLETEIRALGLPINRREVLEAITAAVRLDPTRPGHAELYLGDAEILSAAAAEGKSAESRAAGLAVTLNECLAQGFRAASLQLVSEGDHWVIRALGRTRPLDVLTILPADAAAAGQPLDSFATVVFHRFQARCRQTELQNN
jgi:predicted Zn-dependent protease